MGLSLLQVTRLRSQMIAFPDQEGTEISPTPSPQVFRAIALMLINDDLEEATVSQLQWSGTKRRRRRWRNKLISTPPRGRSRICSIISFNGWQGTNEGQTARLSWNCSGFWINSLESCSATYAAQKTALLSKVVNSLKGAWQKSWDRCTKFQEWGKRWSEYRSVL